MKSANFRLAYILSVAFFTLANINLTVNAQQQPDNTEGSVSAVEHVFVTIPRHRLEADTALPVTVFTGEELRDSIANTLGETLETKPGLANASFGPSVGQPVIRGQQGARVTVLQNSTSSVDAANISADHSVSVEPALAQSIEVLRGPSTLLYGGGAIGGVVNVIDKRVPVSVPDQTAGVVELRHGTVNDETSTVFSLDGGTGSVAFHVDGIVRESNNMEIPGLAVLVHEGEEVEENTDGFIANSNSETRSFTAGTSYIGDKGFIGIAINHLSNKYGIPPGAHGHEEEPGGEEEEEEVDIRLDIEQTRYDIRADIHELTPGIENLRWFFTYGDYEHMELEGTEVGTLWEREGWENRIELLHKPIAGWHGVLGFQIKDTDFSAVGEESYIPRTKIDKLGLFIIEDYHRANWVYELGARADFDKLDPDGLSTNASFNNLSLSASALWEANDSWNVGVALSQSQRSPVIEELYSNDGNNPGDYVEHVATSSIELGNRELDSEESNNIDLTVNFKTNSVDAYITVFYNEFKDYIFLANTGNEQDETPILQYSQEDAEFNGIEFEIAFTLGSAFGGQASLDLFGDRISGELDQAGDVPRLPPQRLGSRLNYGFSAFNAYISVIDADEQDKPGLNEEETEGYTRWNLGASLSLPSNSGQEHQLFAKLKNITDEEIRNSTSFLREIAPEAGRSIELGMRLHF